MVHKPRIVLSSEVFKQIKYFTYNYDKEIGAFGTVKERTMNGEKYFYVEKLVYPEQNVTGASVKISPAMWKSIIVNNSNEDLAKLYFYWHKHPGSANHSHTDEADTFDTMMDDEVKRKYFLFLQTAVKDKKWDSEARIELRNPVRTTIEDENIDLKWEISQEELKRRREKEVEDGLIKENCENIIDTYIKEPVYNFTKSNTGSQKTLVGLNTNGNYKNIEITTDEEAIKQLFNMEKDDKREYIDNDKIGNMSTTPEEKVSLEFKSGCIKIKTGKKFKEVLDKCLVKGGKLELLASPSIKQEIDKKNTMAEIVLAPKRKSWEPLKIKMRELFLEYNKGLRKELNDEINKLKENKTSSEQPITDQLKAEEEWKTETKFVIEINNQPTLAYYIEECIYSQFGFMIENIEEGTLRIYDEEKIVGEIITKENDDDIKIRGTDKFMDTVKIIKQEYFKEEKRILVKYGQLDGNDEEE